MNQKFYSPLNFKMQLLVNYLTKQLTVFILSNNNNNTKIKRIVKIVIVNDTIKYKR